MKLRLISLLFFILLIYSPLSAQVDNHTILKGVNIIDGRNNLLNNMDIRIEGSKIISIYKSNQVTYPDSINVLDLTGKFVMPGLIDSHVHLGQLGIFESPDLTRKEFRRWLFSGITTVREMNGDARLIAYETRLIAINQIPGPDIYYSANYGGSDMIKKDLRIRRATMGVSVEKASWVQTANEEMDIPLSIAIAKGYKSSKKYILNYKKWSTI